MVRVVRVVGQDALGDAARRRLADGKRGDAVEWFRGLDRGEIERAQRRPRRVLLVRRRHEEEDCPWVPFPERGALLRDRSKQARVRRRESNLANTYARLGQTEKALRMRRDLYSGTLKLYGEQHEKSLANAFNYARDLIGLQRFEEAKSLLRKMIPVARRVLGDCHNLTLRMRWCYAQTFYRDPAATLDDLREAVNTLEDTERIARRVLGGAHPVTAGIEDDLQNARATLCARETPPPTRAS